jgi:hypothetical protein
MEYANQELMNDLNNHCIALKVWLHPGEVGAHLSALQRKYPKPSALDIDAMMNRLMQAIRKDSKPMIKY